jgi:predicted phage terminase large subunit-like protein
MYQNTYYLLDVLRDRWEFPDLLRTATAHAANHGVYTVLIEDANSGSALAQSLRLQGGLNVLQIKVLTDKRTRAVQQSAVFEAARVLLPQEASWLAEFEKELLGFPNGRYDDQVDSAVQFLQWAAQLAPYIPIVTPYVVFGEPRKGGTRRYIGRRNPRPGSCTGALAFAQPNQDRAEEDGALGSLLWSAIICAIRLALRGQNSARLTLPGAGGSWKGHRVLALTFRRPRPDPQGDGRQLRANDRIAKRSARKFRVLTT